MNEPGLQKEILDYVELFETYEGLLKVRHKFFVADDHLATGLCQLYAVMASYQIRLCTGSDNEFALGLSCEENENSTGTVDSLPKHETVQKAARELLAALAADDKATVLTALREMRVLTLCPSPACVFAKMDLVAQHVTGRAQQVLLVDLSRFAAKIGDYERASNYLEQARAFDLNSWELYNARLIEGLIALNDGRVDEAVRCLALSISACLAYEKARAQCCIRAPSLELAEKLLDRGEHEAALSHLSDCKDVWEILQPQLDSWILIIKNGGKPDFQAAGNLRIPEKLSHRLRMQWMNACALAGGPVSAEVKSTPPKSVAERKAKRERWMAENPRIIDALAARTIADLEKGFVSPPDRSSTDSSKSS
jgi:tetratricopeptide (TPR) repeat protein